MIEEKFVNSGELFRGVFEPFYGQYREKSVNDKLINEKDETPDLSGLEVEFSNYDGEKTLVYWKRGVDYEVSEGEILIDVYSQIQDANIPDGANYILRYNFFKPEIEDEIYVKSISNNGREIAVRPNPNTSSNFRERFQSLFSKRFKDTAPSVLEGGESGLVYVGNFHYNRYYHVINWSLVTETTPNGRVKTEDGEVQYKDEAIIRFENPISGAISVGDELRIDVEKQNPYFDRFEIFRDEAVTPTNELAGPDFSLEISQAEPNEQFETFEDLTENKTTSESFLENSFSKEVNLNVDFSEFKNFVQYSSAEERIKNFRYKIRKIKKMVGEINVPNVPPGKKETIKRKVKSLIGSFDAYERWLFRSENGYPKTERDLLDPESKTSSKWFQQKLEEAQRYDQQNKSALNKQIPEFVREDEENDQFVLFVNMIGHWFDVNWIYIRQMENLTNSSENAFEPETLSSDLSKTVAQSFGFETFNGFNAEKLFDQLFDTTKIEELFGNASASTKQQQVLSNSDSGSTDIIKSFKKTKVKNGNIDLTPFEAQQQIWRRLLQNVIHFYKNKGTAGSIKALANIFGLPTNPLVIREYGGGKNSDSTKKLQRSSKYFSLFSSQKIEFPWKDGFSETPYGIEMRLRSEFQGGNTLKLFGVVGVLEVIIEKDANDEEARVVIEVRKADGTKEKVKTQKIPILNGEWTNILFQFQSKEEVTLFIKQRSPFGNIRFEERASMKVESGVFNQYKNAESVIVGDGAPRLSFSKGISFVGDIDQLKIWKAPLPEQVFDRHVLVPEKSTYETKNSVDISFSGNFSKTRSLNESGSLDKLMYKTEFENLNEIPKLPNEADSNPDGFLVGAKEENFNDYNRTNFLETIQIGNVPFVKNKIRVEQGENQINLSPDKRRSKEADKISKDSRKIGVFLSPYTFANRDVFVKTNIRSIHSVLGNPQDQFRNSYYGLDGLHKSYWEKHDKPVQTEEYINLIDQFYDAIFKHIRKSIPARASYYDGIVIEPTALERDREPIPRGTIKQK